MTKQAFIEKHRHELAGLVADAFTVTARGGPLAIMIREAFKKIDARLALIYDELCPAPHVPANGKPAPARTN